MLYMLKSTKYYYEMVLRRVTIKARLKLSWDYNHKKWGSEVFELNK